MSHIIASLSAFGIFQTTAKGAPISKDDSFTYTYTSDTTLTANYGTCANVNNADVTATQDASGSTICEIACNVSHYAIYDNETSEYLIHTIDDRIFGGLVTGLRTTIYAPGKYECKEAPKPTCKVVEDPSANGANTYYVVSNDNYSDYYSGYYCKFECLPGYSTQGGTDKSTTLPANRSIATSVNETMSGVASCKPREYTLTFDCGDGHYILDATGISTNNQTKSIKVTYGSTVQLSGQSCSTRALENFEGWELPQQ